MNAKAAASRYQRQVGELARLPGNDACADCNGRNPRWASHNLGIFLCVQCAGVHRKMGTHISKVKSLTLDEWSKEQVERMREFGNLKSNAYYNPNEQRNRPPANVDDGERDNELERFIRNKYEYRRFMDKRPPPVPVKDAAQQQQRSMSSSQQHLALPGRAPNGRASPSPSPNRSASGPASTHTNGSDIHRSRTAPIPATWKDAKRAASPLPALPGERDAAAAKAKAAAAPTTTATPSISVSSLQGTTGSGSYSQTTTASSGLSSNGLSLPHPSLPVRASSAQGYGLQQQQQHSQQPPTHQQQWQPPQSAQTSSSNANFAGRSQVFDDLLSLGQPMQPTQPFQQHQQVYPQQQQQQQMNPWQQQQPQQQSMNMLNTGWPSHQQQQYAQPMMSPQEMGIMAFGYGFPSQQQPPQQQQMYAQPTSNPFWQQQTQQSNYFFQQQQQQPQPQQTADVYQQQRLQTGQVFDDWAKNMMPGRR